MSILFNGNVGIGTTFPTRKFEVRGEGAMEKLIFRTPSSGTWFNIDAPNGANRLDFNVGTATNAKMTILSNGNVGIGKLNPDVKLDVVGDIKGDLIRVSDVGIILKTSASDLALVYYNNFRIVPFDLDGRVIIGVKTITSGTHNTNDVKLTVDGHAIFKKVIVTQTNWSDFVFAKEYRLRPLSEVEQFINTNKHLPDVPSENEVIENGISLGDMDAILLQKIEELTLYMIELQKKNEALEQKIVNLKSK
jgi:hypothetical protein